MVKSANFVVLGDQSIANEFGKKGTSTDITLYDKKESDVIRTWVTPNGFPEKIQPLFHAINLAAGSSAELPHLGTLEARDVDRLLEASLCGALIVGRLHQQRLAAELIGVRLEQPLVVALDRHQGLLQHSQRFLGRPDSGERVDPLACGRADEAAVVVFPASGPPPVGGERCFPAVTSRGSGQFRGRRRRGS